MSRGVIYSVVGERYVAEATRSAQSSLRFNPLPHVIFCDPVPAEAAADVTCRPLARGSSPYTDKIRSMIDSPFDQTLFLDSDTYVCAPVGALFDLLERFDLCASHVPGYTKGPDPVGSEAFFDFNTGVIAYAKNDRTDRFLREWLKTYEAWIDDPPFVGSGLTHAIADQPAFRRCVWESDLQVYVLPQEYNYRTVFPGRLVGYVKIIHGRVHDYATVQRILDSKFGTRTFQPFAQPCP